jgi:hypothetical protein
MAEVEDMVISPSSLILSVKASCCDMMSGRRGSRSWVRTIEASEGLSDGSRNGEKYKLERRRAASIS